MGKEGKEKQKLFKFNEDEFSIDVLCVEGGDKVERGGKFSLL